MPKLWVSLEELWMWRRKPSARCSLLANWWHNKNKGAWLNLTSRLWGNAAPEMRATGFPRVRSSRNMKLFWVLLRRTELLESKFTAGFGAKPKIVGYGTFFCFFFVRVLSHLGPGRLWCFVYSLPLSISWYIRGFVFFPQSLKRILFSARLFDS